MSSGHNPDHTKSIRRKKGDGSSIDVECPVSIVDYNQHNIYNFIYLYGRGR